MYEEEPATFANKWVLLVLLFLGTVIIGLATYMYERSQNEGVLYTCTVAPASTPIQRPSGKSGPIVWRMGQYEFCAKPDDHRGVVKKLACALPAPGPKGSAQGVKAAEEAILSMREMRDRSQLCVEQVLYDVDVTCDTSGVIYLLSPEG